MKLTKAKLEKILTPSLESMGYTKFAHKGSVPLCAVFYRERGHKKIDVRVQYPSKNHKTNGGTKR